MKKPTYKGKELLPLSVIDAARDGDSQAVDQVLRYYEGYINKLCTRTLYDPDGPCSRFFIRRLKSGRLLMINHYNFDQRIDLDDIMNQGNVKSWKGRSHLTAMLSEDDGETWPYTLLLDERNEVSYPDAKEADNGYIYVTYDWERVTQREILMARFTEDDILRGKILSPEGKLRVLVNKALGQPDIH